MPVSCDEGEALSLIHLQGDVNISCATEFKKILLAALGRGNDIHVDVRCVTEADVTVLQLLWAAEREAKGLGVGVKFLGPWPEDVGLALAATGFEEFPLPARPI
jgi:anti-anti-sigma regulatory factor